MIYKVTFGIHGVTPSTFERETAREAYREALGLVNSDEKIIAVHRDGFEITFEELAEDAKRERGGRAVILDHRPHQFQGDIDRFFVRVIAPALVNFLPLPLFQGPPADACPEHQNVYFESMVRYTSNAVAIEARRAFALALAAIFERQLAEYCRNHVAEPLEAFGAMLDAVVNDARIDASDLKPDLKELHLVANVVRHGDGRSLKKLRERAPSLWPDAPNIQRGKETAEAVTVTDGHFRKYAGAIATFWGRASMLAQDVKEVRYPDLATLLAVHDQARELQNHPGEAGVRILTY